MPKLHRCKSCACHVLSQDLECPFCGHRAANEKLRVYHLSSSFGRGAMLAGGLAVAATGLGCGASTGPTLDTRVEADAGVASDTGTDGATGSDTGTGTDNGTDTGTDTGTIADAGEDTGTIRDAGPDMVSQPPYGISPMDAGDAEPIPVPAYGISPGDGGF